MSTRRNSDKVGQDERTLKLSLPAENSSYFLLSLKVLEMIGGHYHHIHHLFFY